MILPLPIKVEDDPAPLEFIQHNGYYEVGHKIFNFKISAFQEASRTNESIKWNFNEEQYRQFNWRTPLNIDLRLLYKARAQQLRDKYDYLVLSYSGGSDSHTVLQSFIHNNIHIDEIVCDWPLAHTSQYAVSNNISTHNTISEWELTIKPALEYIRQYHPEIKITITDSQEELAVEDHENSLTFGHIGLYQNVRRFRTMSERISKLNEEYNHVAVVLGIEKPQFFIEHNILCIFFSDQSTFFKSSHLELDRMVEYFYWTVDMPEITREQGHSIYQYILQNPQSQKMFHKDFVPATPAENVVFQRLRNNLIISIIYPDWDFDKFQANKPFSTINSEQVSWMYRAPSRAVDAWRSLLKTQTAIIDPKYLEFYTGTNRLKDFKNNFSRLYPIGKLPPLSLG